MIDQRGSDKPNSARRIIYLLAKNRSLIASSVVFLGTIIAMYSNILTIDYRLSSDSGQTSEQIDRIPEESALDQDIIRGAQQDAKREPVASGEGETSQFTREVMKCEMKYGKVQCLVDQATDCLESALTVFKSERLSKKVIEYAQCAETNFLKATDVSEGRGHFGLAVFYDSLLGRSYIHEKRPNESPDDLVIFHLCQADRTQEAVHNYLNQKRLDLGLC